MAEISNGRAVFVGNIPFDQTEEQILEIFQSVGPVAQFRFVFDKDTGRPKGYAFVEYHDAETAASAVRNLNYYDINGRPIRVDFSHESSLSEKSESIASQIPSGTIPPPTLSTPDAISRTLSAFTPSQMLNILQELKGLVGRDPGKARELLNTSPQLSYAVVQTMLLMGLVDAKAVANAVDQSQLAAQKQQQQQQTTVHQPPIETPVPAGGYYGQAAAVPVDAQRAALIAQVKNLSDEQLAALPAGQRAPLEALRDKIRRGEF
ncbi:uncharacterized protein V1516DRAFT_665651 [Lipomyces oligophaga]|uniref:uncharacterized protein n=1 Tax=Lipomyces oligophaga TaxID=45792 RepID=UPI0034CD1729